MKLAFCLFKHFPYSGLSRDCVRVLTACRERGHDVHVFTSCWEGDQPQGIDVEVLPCYRWMNHTQNATFYRKLRERLDEENFDVGRVMKCSIGVPEIDGSNIPTCSYNVLYREHDTRFADAEMLDRMGHQKHPLIHAEPPGHSNRGRGLPVLKS